MGEFYLACVAGLHTVRLQSARQFLVHVLAYRLFDFYLKFRSGGVERLRPSRPCKSPNKPTGSLRSNERHSIMQLLGAKNNDTVVEPNRAEPWSAFSEGRLAEGRRPIPCCASPVAVEWCHFTWAAGWGSGPRTTRRVAAPHQPANIHESRRPKPVDFGRHVHL